MKFKIHHNDDEIILEAEDIENIQKQTMEELSKRNWKIDDCWSEEWN